MKEIASKKNIDFSQGSTREIGVAFAKKSWGRKFTVLSIPTGHGKTAISCVTIGTIKNGIRVTRKFEESINVFIIAPKGKINDGSWEATIEAYNEQYPNSINIIGTSTPTRLGNARRNEIEYNKYSKKQRKKLQLDYEKNLKIRRERSKIRKDKRAEGIEPDESELPQLIPNTINIEGREMLTEIVELLNEKPTVIIVDEAHYFKSATSQRSKALDTILKKANEAIAIGLTATPMANGIVEDGIGYLVFNQYYPSKSNFEKIHIPPKCKDKFYNPDVYDKYGNLDKGRFNNIEEFKQKIRDTVFVPEVTVDFDIPEAKMSVLRYSLSGRTALELKELASKYRKRHYTSYMQYLSDIRKTISSDIQHKRELSKVLYAYNERKQPLIFYSTNEELDAIKFTLEMMNLNYSVLNSKNHYNKIDVGNLEQVIVIQYKAGGVAVEFPKSQLTVFYGLQHSWIDMKQAEGRNVRRGQTGEVEQIVITSDNPYDVAILDCLERKVEFTDKLYEELAEEVSKHYVIKN